MPLLAVILALLPIAAQAQSWTPVHAAVAAQVGANALDAASNWSGPERTRWLQDEHGRFSMPGLQRKLAVSAGIAGLSYLIAWRWPGTRRYVALFNGGVAAAWTGAAVHNWRAR